jgi:hypothetical protein
MGHQMNGMYVVGVLFILPSALLGAGWTTGLRIGKESSRPNWRTYALYAALMVATCSTLAGVGFFVSWFHNGGSPHGMTPPQGLWKPLGRVFMSTLVASVALAICGKGKPRFLVLGWAAAVVVATAMIFMLEMD